MLQHVELYSTEIYMCVSNSYEYIKCFKGGIWKIPGRQT